MATAIHTSYYRGFQCLLTSSDTGWTVWVNGSPILFDMIYCDFRPAYSWVDLLVVFAGGVLPTAV